MAAGSRLLVRPQQGWSRSWGGDVRSIKLANIEENIEYLETIEVNKPPALSQNCARQVRASVIEISTTFGIKYNQDEIEFLIL